MPLFQRRKRLRERARSASPPPFTTNFDLKARNRLLFAMMDAAPDFLGEHVWGNPGPQAMLLRLVHGTLQREWGDVVLAAGGPPHDDLTSFVTGPASDEQLVDVMEATLLVLAQAEDEHRYTYGQEATDQFRAQANRILDEHDIAYRIVDLEAVPRSSMVMDSEVVMPALALLSGHRGLANVEQAFRDALRELKPGGDPADAITDAARALQEMLVALGCRGNSIGPLLDDARKKDLLGPHDSGLALGVEKIGDWVNADRSERGDAHLVKATDRDDAWLAVHVVGALILRLEKRL